MRKKMPKVYSAEAVTLKTTFQLLQSDAAAEAVLLKGQPVGSLLYLGNMVICTFSLHLFASKEVFMGEQCLFLASLLNATTSCLMMSLLALSRHHECNLAHYMKQV